MASPSNASEPETPEEEEIIPAGFDPILFWDQNRQAILVVAVIVILALAGYGWYAAQQASTIAAAETALANASNEDDFNQIIAKYPGTTAAGNATLLLAGKLRDAKRYDDAIQTLQTFMDKYPKHPLIAAGDLGIAQVLDNEGKQDEALSRYEEVAAKYQDSYTAPVALLAQASILRHQGKNEEARRVYENFVTQFPDSVFAQEANAEMRMILSTATPASSENNGTNQSLLDAIKAAAAASQHSPAPVAPPSMPVPPATGGTAAGH
jgi:predicted negative regulator of RcsB-dependent stress response